MDWQLTFLERTQTQDKETLPAGIVEKLHTYHTISKFKYGIVCIFSWRNPEIDWRANQTCKGRTRFKSQTEELRKECRWNRSGVAARRCAHSTYRFDGSGNVFYGHNPLQSPTEQTGTFSDKKKWLSKELLKSGIEENPDNLLDIR